MMEIIGFIAALLFSGYLCFAGAAMIYAMLAISDEFSWFALLLLVAGLVGLVFTFAYAPFTVSINTP